MSAPDTSVITVYEPGDDRTLTVSRQTPQALFWIRFSRNKATISRKVGGTFTAYGGSLSGTNLELVPDKKIVQAWRANDWPAGHHSKATFSLTPVKGGTRLNFYQSGVPAEHYASIKQGWIDFYWKRMKALLEK